MTKTLDRIKRAQKSQFKTLNLASRRLQSLPPEIGQLSKLKTLNLFGNQLTQLPPEIGQLSQLTDLSLSNNQLTQLPPEIGQLSQLKTLALYGNQLTQLPPEFGHLSQLEMLHLQSNQLTQLPPEFGQLSQLKMLRLEGNPLVELPPEIGQLSQLTDLELTNNQLMELPPQIAQLPQLKALCLHDNERLDIPPDILGPSWLEQCRAIEKRKPARPADILEYYLRSRREASRPLLDTRMPIVRQGAGKTSLVNRLAHNRFEGGLEESGSPAEGRQIIMGDQYVIHGQIGAAGRKAHAEGNTFQQQYQAAAKAFDLVELAAELARLRETMQEEARELSQHIAVGEVAKAEQQAREGKGGEALKRLKAAGQWSCDVATKIGTAVATKAIQIGMGL